MVSGTQKRRALGGIERRPGSLSKQPWISRRPTARQRRCHRLVTSKCEFGELAGDGLRRSLLVRLTSRVIAGQRNSALIRLGVKKSQAQILSARLTNRVSGLRRRDIYRTKRLEVGAFWGPQSAERAVPRVRDGLPVGVQITLAREVAVTIRRTRPLRSRTLWRLVATLVGM